MDLAFGVRADEQLAGFAGPVPFFGLDPLQQGENGHHALQSPHANVLARRDHNFAAVQHETVPYQDRLIAIPVDSFRGDFQFKHGLVFPLSNPENQRPPTELGIRGRLLEGAWATLY